MTNRIKFWFCILNLTALCGLQAAAPAQVPPQAAADAQHAQRFAHNPDVQYANNQLTFLQSNFSSAKTVFSLIGAALFGAIAYVDGSAKSADEVAQPVEKDAEPDVQEKPVQEKKKWRNPLSVLGWSAATASAACLGYLMHHLATYKKVPVMSFNRDGVFDAHGRRMFTWQEYQRHEVNDVYRKTWHAHTVKPNADNKQAQYEHQTGYWTNEYLGRRATFYGRHNERVWEVGEYDGVPPMRLNDLIDTVQHYKINHGQ